MMENAGANRTSEGNPLSFMGNRFPFLQEKTNLATAQNLSNSPETKSIEIASLGIN